ncbi:MAG: hypothetical protein QM756_32770 [Polyangiaceae bacterium]
MENTCGIRVGRLLEVRVVRAYRTPAEVDAMFTEIGAEARKLPAETRIVTVADWRHCPLMSAEASEQARLRMTGNNARTERSAVLAQRDAGVATLQFLRIIRETNYPNRKLFFELDELVEWLTEVLTAPEVARLREFLAEVPLAKP